MGSSPDQDRLKAIALLEAGAATSGKNHRLDDWGSKDDREFALKVKQFNWERIKAIISIFGLAATIFAGVGLYLTYQNAQAEKQLNTERLITDRFSKSVEQLGSKEISVRIGGIYALERIAKDSPKDHWTVMEVLTAFVRERSPNRQSSPGTSNSKPSQGKEPELPRIATDVQSALTAIGRRDASQDPQGQSLDLSQTYLVGAILVKANLQEASLDRANLQEASLDRANLQGAILVKANLQGARLNSANLPGAILFGANLQGAFLFGANLQEASLDGANLQGASLDRANLQGASLDGANLQGASLDRANLQGASLDKANLQGAILLATDLRNAEKLTQTQLEGSDPPLLCNVALPPAIKVNPNRDCDRLPQELLKRYPDSFTTLEEAKAYVDVARQQKWK